MPELVLIAAAALFGWSLTGLLRRAFVAAGHAAPVTSRGLHARPIPAGGGLAIVATVVVLWPVWSPADFADQRALLIGVGLLVLISWLDDQHGIAVAPRLAVQLFAIAIVLASLDPARRLWPALPLLAERLALALAWTWFVNLFNFMDGIDGLAGAETIAIALGSVAVAGTAGIEGGHTAPALLLAAATAGFLVWNWAPARIFLGDAGSVPLGFLLGWLLLDLALRGLSAPALLLPLYFVADATITLAARLLRGERPWHAHREHFYQRAVLAGRTHAAIVGRVIAADGVLILAALIAVRAPQLGIAIGVAAVALLIRFLSRHTPPQTPQPIRDERA